MKTGLIGLYTQDGRVQLNPLSETLIEAGISLLPFLKMMTLFGCRAAPIWS
jgi:hypothetical protein